MAEGPSLPCVPCLVVLAAGASQRMGAPKALLRFSGDSREGGERFLDHILGVAEAVGVSAAVVVLGPPHGEEVAAALATPNSRIGSTLRSSAAIAWNSAPERGMLSSFQEALPLLPVGAAGTLVWPVDMPFVQPDTLRCILKSASVDPRMFLIPTHHGRGGHPIWVPGDLFAEALRLPGEAGLRALRQRHPERELRLPVADPGVLCDVDTREELAQAQRWLGGSAPRAASKG